jgi:sulfur-carrier protein
MARPFAERLSVSKFHRASLNKQLEQAGSVLVTVLVRIPTILRSYTGGAAEVEVTAPDGTLREVIAGLDAAYPGIGGRILDDAGKLRRFVNVYVGDEDVRFAQGLDTPVAEGTRVSVIPAVAGGAPESEADEGGMA